MREALPRWQLDRQISLGVIIAIALQTAGALMWTGEAGARLRHLESRIAQQDPVLERLARLEEQARDIRAGLNRIERRLDGEGPL